MKGSWKTSAAGASSILGGLALVAKGISENNFEAIGSGITAVIAGIGLILARDNNVTSEQAGVKPTDQK